MTSLDVYLHEQKVGRLERLPGARLGFAYESTWVATGGPPLSLSLPVREAPYADEACRPFFAGLLPEGEFLKAIARAFHISAENSFSVLQEIGGECAGAISLVPEGSPPPFLAAADPRWLDEIQLQQLLEDLPSRALLAPPDSEGEGIRLSLAGTRDKLPVLWEPERVGITRGRPPSTHILKKPVPELADMVANEAYCLALAGESGLEVASASPIMAGEQEGLLVRRFDRREDSQGAARRVHQEDFCQALALLPEEKYQAEGGPSVAVCAGLIQESTAAPAVDLLAFLDALIFNFLIGNTDAHAKNYSLLLEGDGSPRLAPLYDLLSARAYWPFDRKMAMKYGGEYRGDRVRGRHLDRLAADLTISAGTVRAHARDVAGRAMQAMASAREHLPEPWRGAALIDRIDALLAETADELRRAAAETS